MRTRDFLDLVRIPNVLTAVSDVLAATAVVAATSPESLRWVGAAWAAGASAALYCAGMALNDVADASADAIERPARPIPSGRVRRGEAVGASLALILAGLGLAWGAGSATLIVAVALLGAIVIYDLAAAGRPLWGPAAMAVCRSMNLLLGLTAAGAVDALGWVAVALWFVYVFGVTHLSLSEVHGGPKVAVAIAALTTLLVGLTLSGIARHQIPGDDALAWGAWAASLLLWWGPGAPALLRAAKNPSPARIGAAVGALVGGIIGLGASLATAAASTAWLPAFVALALGHQLLRRRFRVT